MMYFLPKMSNMVQIEDAITHEQTWFTSDSHYSVKTRAFHLKMLSAFSLVF